MENKSRSDVLGSADAPYENALAKQCATALDYRGLTHPSLPNYIAATSGDTWGIDDDGPPSEHPLDAVSLFSQVRTWRSYQESAPGPCPQTSTGRFAQKHDPAIYYTRLAATCPLDDLPLGTPSSGALARDLSTGRLPAFSLITPDLCNDTHDCPVATGDAWLQRWSRASCPVARIGPAPPRSSSSGTRARNRAAAVRRRRSLDQAGDTRASPGRPLRTAPGDRGAAWRPPAQARDRHHRCRTRPGAPAPALATDRADRLRDGLTWFLPWRCLLG